MPTVLFLCVENSCRSQMAEGFARKLAGARWIVASAGSRPSGKVDETAIALMAEEGIDLTSHRPKGLAEVVGVPWDVIVTMGCGDECPGLSARKRVEWDLLDPKGMPTEQFRRMRDEIGRRVAALMRHLPPEVPPD